MFRKQIVRMALFAAALGSASQVMASSVPVDTFGGSGWMVSTDGGNTYSAVKNVPQNPAWAAPAFVKGVLLNSLVAPEPLSVATGEAPLWVNDTGLDTTKPNETNGTHYIYKLDFNASPDSAPVVVNLAFSVDNWAASATFDGNTLALDPNEIGNEFVYATAYTLTGYGGSHTNPHELIIDTVNSFGSGSYGFINSLPPGPEGFILAGVATAPDNVGGPPPSVPLPAAFWPGLMGMGFVVLLAGRRRMKSLSVV